MLRNYTFLCICKLISIILAVMLKVILNRLKPQAEDIIAEEQAGFGAGRSTTEQQLSSEYSVRSIWSISKIFIDFKKAFDRAWYAALWANMRKYNISENLVKSVQQYDKACSAVLTNGKLGHWFRTTVGVGQGFLLSPTLFNMFIL